jgi:hypothetical protein
MNIPPGTKKPNSGPCGHKFCPILNLLFSFESRTIELSVCQKLLKSTKKRRRYNQFREVHSKPRVYAGRDDAFGSLEELGEAAKRAWRENPMENIRKAIDRFRGRLEMVAAHDGGPIQHIAQ